MGDMADWTTEQGMELLSLHAQGRCGELGGPCPECEAGVSFRLVRFNPRRAARNVGAAEVEIADADNSVRLWMTPADIEANIRDHGPHPGLLAAREAYRRKVEIREKPC